MLAWRSLLNRPQPLFPRLRHVSHRAIHRSAVLGSHNSLLIGSRGYASNNSNGDDSRADVNRHLYLVLDDSKDGFGIHKLAVDDEDPDGGARRRLPEPPLLRVAFPTVDKFAHFAAVGSSILAVGTCTSIDGPNEENGGGVLIYDTKTAAQVFSPQLPRGIRDWSLSEVAITVGNRLYMFESTGSEGYYKYSNKDLFPSGLHCLVADRGGENDKFWNWRPLSPPCPLDNEQNPFPPSSSWYWSDPGYEENLLMLPFDAGYIRAHAVHTPPGAAPHEVDIFVSVSSRGTASHKSATFSFSTPTRRERTHPLDWERCADGDRTITLGWTRRGDWRMPVVGQAHYDGKLDTWLGLHLREFRWPDGYLCAGNVMSAPSEWKVGKEKFCCLDEDTAAGWIHVDAKLVPMASTNDAGTEYCLMERLKPEKGECLGDGDKCLLRLTTFHVKSGEDGEPVATASRPVRSYKVSRYNNDFEAQVFWM